MAEVSVDYTHPQYACYAPEWTQIRDCVAGERAVKAKGERYLPHPANDPDKSDASRKRYRAYKLRAPFVNATNRTLQAMLGVAFMKPVQLELPGVLADLEEDCDGKGTPAAQVLRQTLGETLQTGRFGFLTDYSLPARFTEDGEFLPYTAEEEAKAKIRIELYFADEIINWRTVGGVDTLVVLKSIEEAESKDPNDFQVYPITVWTELRLLDGVAHMRRWYYNNSAKNVELTVPRGYSATDLAPLKGVGGKSLDRLPWSWGGSNDNNSSIDAAPLADIASLNIKHFIAEADLAEIAHLVQQPMLVNTGLTQAWVDKNLKGGIEFGSGKSLNLPEGADAKLLQAEERNLSLTLAERREEQMAKLGAALIAKGTAPKTATEANYDAQTDNSILALCAGNVEAAFNKALENATLFTGAKGSVALNKFYSTIVIDSGVLTAMMSGVQSGTILLADFIKWMQAQGIIDDSKSPEEIETELRNQNPLPQMAPPDPVDPNAEDDEKDSGGAANNPAKQKKGA